MSSSEKTTNLQLNKWKGEDRSQREDFNYDNQKIDEWAGQVNTQLNEIENNKTEGKVRFISNDNKSILGVTFPCTCLELANAMENGDVLFCNASIISDTPSSYGHIFVMKHDKNRVEFQFKPALNDSNNNTVNQLYIATYREMSDGNKFSGWSLVLTEDKIINNLSATTAGFLLDATQGKALYDKSIFYKGTLTTTVDLNSYLNNGEWYFANASGFVNAPNNLNYFMLSVHGVGMSKVIQEVTSVLAPFEKYYRVYNNGTFNSWYKITSIKI